MKRGSSSEYNFDSKRFESSSCMSPYYQQAQPQCQPMPPPVPPQQHQRAPIPPLVQQFQAQQDLQYQMQQRIQAQQQQQYAATQQFYSQTPYFPMNQISYPAYSPAQNSGWNFLSTPPPPYFEMTPPPSVHSPQPPLPPPDHKNEKPPLPREPEPAKGRTLPPNRNTTCTDTGSTTGQFGSSRNMNGLGSDAESVSGLSNGKYSNGQLHSGRNYNGTLADSNSANGLSNPGRNFNGTRLSNAQRGRGANGYNRGGRGGNRGRGRRNTNFFSQMHHTADINDLAKPFDEDQPAGPEKMTIFLNNPDGGKITVSKKAKRKPMSTRYTKTKQWTKEDAEAAIALEKEFNQTQKRQMLILKFPDPDLNKFIVKKYSPYIEVVHFQQPSTPRYCFVQLKEDADVEKVLNQLRQIPFGTGKISAELKNQQIDDQPVTPEEIDPYTLYIGNLPTHISVKVVKECFPNAQRIDIGYAQRMRYTRYAFIRYNSVQEAMDSFRYAVHALLDSRSLIVRFRRQKGNIGLPGESKSNAPPRDGRAILPGKEPKPLEKQDELKDGDKAAITDDEDKKVKDDDSDEVMEIGTETENSPSKDDSKLSRSQKKNNRKKRKKETQSAECSNIQTTPQTNGTEEDTKKSEPDTSKESIDSKEKVLEEANELINKADTVPNIDDKEPLSPGKESTSTPNRLGYFEGDIKLEHSDEDSSDDGGINLLGTRVKDEPFIDHNRPPTPSLDDIYLDDYAYDDFEDDPDESTETNDPEEPEEDDDDWVTDSIFPNPPADWDEFRRNELNSQENKPDLSKLEALPPVRFKPPMALASSSTLETKLDLSATLELESSATLDPSSTLKSEEMLIPPIPADIEPKKEIEELFASTKRNKPKTSFSEKDDLNDIFAQLNSDTDCEDEDAFF